MKIRLLLTLFLLTNSLVACQINGEETSNDTANNTYEKSSSNDDSFYADALAEEVQYITNGLGELSDESYDFIVNNHRLFPAIEEKEINDAKELSEVVDVKLLNKNMKPHLTTIIEIKGQVVQIEEETYDNGETAAFVNVVDEDWNNHHVLIFKSTGDILEDDQVDFIGIPITSYNYDTLDGGSQNAIIFFGSHIEKE